MGRGKLEIKRIESTTNRQVTFSKRRNGILKKAEELAVLCDAKISVLIVPGSNSKKVYHYISPGVDLKEMYDEYQRVEGVDLWRKHYEEMQGRERKLLQDNARLRRDICRRMGGNIEELSARELSSLEQEMYDALVEIRTRKYKVLKNQSGTSKKKIKSLEDIQRSLVYELETRFRAPEFGIVDEGQGDYEAAAVYANNGVETANLFGINRHPQHHTHQQLGRTLGYTNIHDLRLA